MLLVLQLKDLCIAILPPSLYLRTPWPHSYRKPQSMNRAVHMHKIITKCIYQTEKNNQ